VSRMRLHEFLRQSAEPAPTRPVEYKAVWVDPRTMLKTVRDVRAVLVYLSEHERQESISVADASLTEKFKDKKAGPDEGQRTDEEAYHVLAKALRSVDNPAVQFVQTVDELRRSLTNRTLRRLSREYSDFLEKEFPDKVDKKTMEEMVEEAQGK